MTSFVFRVVANVVNSAAWAANGLLEVMWPKDLYEPAFSVASGGPAAPCADPHPAGAADPAGASDAPPSPPAGSLTSSRSGVCDCGHWLHPGNICAACGCNYSRLAATPAPSARSLNLPWEVIDLTDPPYNDGLGGFPWAIADRWGVIIGRFGTETQAYAVIEAVSGLVGGPLLW